jgi:putative ABC transport system substrate-binding protein
MTHSGHGLSDPLLRYRLSRYDACFTGEAGLRRRAFIAGLGVAAAWPVVARAQQTVMPTIGFLDGLSQAATLSNVAAFKEGLLDTGYVEGKNVMIEFRWANAQYDQLPALAGDLVRHQVAVIATDTPVAALAAKQATTSIPIVFGLGSDPVRDGLVVSFNRPAGNITGATFYANLLSGKRLELFHRLIPNAAVIAVLLNPKNANVEFESHQIQEAARLLGLQLVFVQATGEREIDEAVASLIQQGAAALYVSGDGMFYSQRAQIAELALRYKVSTSCPFRNQTVAGCLMSYGANVQATFRQAGNYVGRILKGEKPSDLPVQQPTKFELAINLKTAKALNLEIPRSLLLIADEVIE